MRRAGATEEWYRALLSRLAIRAGTLDAGGCEMAANLRVERLERRRRRRWRMPDALVVGEALASNADRVVTTDADWLPIDGLSVEVLAPAHPAVDS
ncbi:MAG: hypothetical protein ACLGHX_05305 [Acidimicrobiia bacterium]